MVALSASSASRSAFASVSAPFTSLAARFRIRLRAPAFTAPRPGALADGVQRARHHFLARTGSPVIRFIGRVSRIISEHRLPRWRFGDHRRTPSVQRRFTSCAPAQHRRQFHLVLNRRQTRIPRFRTSHALPDASSAISTLPQAVITTTGNSGSFCCTRESRSNPSSPEVVSRV